MKPKETKINARQADWTPEIYAEWYTRVVPRFKEHERCLDANYHTPRPYVDEYNRGSDKFGFVYTVLNEQSADRLAVCYVEWTR